MISITSTLYLSLEHYCNRWYITYLKLGKIMSRRTGRQRHWYQLSNKEKITKKQENRC
ncbi:hypothetical protein THF5H11_11417 [Vibrio jasicida]|uniref:Uncharacterized protein n=1 Tax=Vibrio jasicida TaxID=766224 RepID=A0AAU9QM03_9VIBR|nr:hypothetical protein THF5H11_11417 [Vibrio jasicida]CAH1572906.1 hypothetical protein THF1C08_190037 [Vibrio jasicida]CAH1588246.1 hypothetical protein THF1A12_200037 [Vibrio jasicida]CAH1604530.1 hypothetical protein THF5G08_10419 [Vibrio jasicida]